MARATPPLGTRGIGDSPPRALRLTGQALTRLVALAPAGWPLIRGATRRFFDRAAADWDERINPDSPERLAVIEAAAELLDRTPERILDLGTGTGAGALMLARRYPQAEVRGVDISESMIRAAQAKMPADAGDRISFSVEDAAALPFPDASFDLVLQVSVPVFFDEIARVTRPEGHAMIVHTLGASTPFYTPDRILREGFEKRGFSVVRTGGAGKGTFFLARRPPSGA